MKVCVRKINKGALIETYVWFTILGVCDWDCRRCALSLMNKQQLFSSWKLERSELEEN